MWSVLVLVVALVALGSGSPVWIGSPISTGGRPLVSVLAVPEARARLVGEIEGLMDELNLPCKDRIRTTMFVALMHFEAGRVAMETARFKEMELMPLLAKLDIRTRERLIAAIHRLSREVLEEPVIAEHEWAISHGKNTIVKTFIQTFLHLERTLRETPELLTVGKVKRTLMTAMSELKGLRDCTELVPTDEAKVECERIKTRFMKPTHAEGAFYKLEAELREIIPDPVMCDYILDTLKTMASKSVSFMAYKVTSLNTLIHSGTQPTKILVNWLYTISTMGYNIRQVEESYGKPESMRYPFARYPSSKYPSPFPSSFPSLKYPKASAYPYGLPISVLPYPSPFPTHFMDSCPIPSDMDHLANKLYSAPYLFALGSGHHLKVREELKSVVSTVDLARSINLPSPADPCFSQKLTAFNAVLLSVLNSVDYSIISSAISHLLKEVALSTAENDVISAYPIDELINSPDNKVVRMVLGRELLKPEMMAMERLYNIPELRPILSHHYALLSSAIHAPGHIAPKMIASVLKGVAEAIRTDEALCRLDVKRVVPEIEEVLSVIASSLSWNTVEDKLVSGLKKCETMKGMVAIPEARIIEIISKLKPVYQFHLRHHSKIASDLITDLSEGRPNPNIVADLLVSLEEINMAAGALNESPLECTMGEGSWSEMPRKMWRGALEKIY